jgi:hypothetical protein
MSKVIPECEFPIQLHSHRSYTVNELDLCLSLLKADTEDEVVALLSNAGYWTDRDAWRYFGDLENNWSTIGNQQSSPHAALVEKLVNAVDATLMGHCYAAGIDPMGTDAPRSMRAAVAQFFDRTTLEQSPSAGLIRNWTANQRTQVAQSITLVATGSKSKPNFSIADAGEGQTPDDMPETLLSLGKSNKLRIPFVQGQHNMGGTGAFKFCGKQNLQLVVTRRHPKALKAYSRDSQLWGFTVIRREDPERWRRSSVFTYLAPLGKDVQPGRGGVLRFAADEFPLFPQFEGESNRNPCGRLAKWGTLIKLYEYLLPAGGRSNILMKDGLMRRTDLLLPDTALPIRFCEARTEFKGKAASFENTLTGLSVRLDDDKTNNLEDGFPTSCPLAASGEAMKATIYAFKEDKAKTYRNDEGIVFTLNGQTHGYLTPDFFRRKSVGLSYLSDSLLVVIDCSQFTGRAREDLFMNSRDRLSKGELRASIESELEDMIKNHQGLRELKERRRREETEARLADSKPLEDVLEMILKHSPSLANLFLLGKRASNPFKTRQVQENEKPFSGVRFPTFFKFKGKDYGNVLERESHINMRCRITFETDADNDYFSRPLEPGGFSLYSVVEGNKVPVSNFTGPNMTNGIATLSVKLPEDAEVGSKVEFLSVVTDEYREHPFENRFNVLVKPEAVPIGGGRNRRKPPSDVDGTAREQPAGIVLPNIIEVREDEWGKHRFDRHTALKIKDAGDSDQSGSNDDSVTRYDFFINVDNLYLKTEMKAAKADVPLLKARFTYGMVLVGLGLLQQRITTDATQNGKEKSERDDEEDRASGGIEERVEQVTTALAPIILPMIESLGGIDIAEAETATASGEAT